MYKILLTLLLLPVLFVTEKLHAAPQVIFVPGWQVLAPKYEQTKTILEELFPGYEVVVWQWDAKDKNFEQCAMKAEAEVHVLSEKIANMSAADRDDLILVGHSLGAMIIIKTMKQLADRKLQIDRGIFMAATIPDNDPSIADAITASKRSNINIYHPRDQILRDIYGVYSLYKAQHMFSLGAFGYAEPCLKSRLYQIKAAEYIEDYNALSSTISIDEHRIIVYLECLKKMIGSAENVKPGEMDRSTASNVITIPTTLVIEKAIPIPGFARGLLKTETLASCKQWLLVHFFRNVIKFGKLSMTIPDIYCVFDARARLVGFTMNKEIAEQAFRDIEKQLQNL